MSFFGFGQPQLSSAQKIAAAEQELEMVTDMFNRMTASCQRKCIPTDYREDEMNKGESVCIDRCVSKFFEINMKVSERMQSIQASKTGGAGGIPGFGH